MIKRTILIIFSLLALTTSCFSQNTLAGKVVDAGGNPISYANIQMLSMPDSAFVQGCVSGVDGSFVIQYPDSIDAMLKLSGVGYKESWIKLSQRQSSENTFVLTEDAYALSDITVTARKRMVKSLVDRYQIDIANLKDRSFDMMDLLAKVPGVIVSNDMPSILGKSGFRLMVNNHIQKITGSQAVAYLKSIDLRNVDKLEIIQNPPAKYEAEGDYGIIHIITKKSERSMGGRISDGLSYADNYWTNDTYLSFNAQTGKLSVFALGSYLYGKNKYKEWNSQNYRGFERISDMEQVNRPQNYSLYAGIDYGLTKNVSFGGSVSWYNGKMKRCGNDIITTKSVSVIADSVITSTLERDMPLTKRDAMLYFSCQNKNAGVELSANYFDYDNQQNSHYDSFLNTGAKVEKDVAFYNDNSNHVKGFSGMADFNLTLNPITFTFGGKITASKTPTETSYTPKVVDFTANSTYRENIYAFYAQATSRIGKQISVKLGFRYEGTHTKTIVDGDYDDINRKYGNWFPNMFVSYKINANNSFRLSYTGSIQRPNLQYISPFVIYSTIKDYTSGNPYLKPVTTQRLGLNYTFMGNLIVEMYYSVSNNIISQILNMDEESRVTESKWENGKRNKTLGLNLMYIWDRLKWVSGTFFAFGSYVNSSSKTPYTREHSEYANGVLMMNLNFMMNAKRTWTCGLNARYTSTENNCDTKTEGYGNLGCYTQIALLKKSLTANLSVNNILQPKVKGEAYSNGMTMHFENCYSPLTIKLSLAYTFGLSKRDKTQKYGDKDIKNRI